MKKSIWIFLLAVLLPGAVLGWLALRSAGEQQIIFERRTAELYQKETEDLAAAVRETIEAERRAFSDVIHRLLGKSNADELARDFTNTLSDAWNRKAVGFAISADGQMLSPSAALAAKDAGCREFIWNNSSFLCSTRAAIVYPVPVASAGKSVTYGNQLRQRGQSLNDLGQVAVQNTQVYQQQAAPEPEPRPALVVTKGDADVVLAQKPGASARDDDQQRFVKKLIIEKAAPPATPPPQPITATQLPAADAKQRIASEDTAKGVGRASAQLEEKLKAGAENSPIADPAKPMKPAPAPAPEIPPPLPKAAAAPSSLEGLVKAGDKTFQKAEKPQAPPAPPGAIAQTAEVFKRDGELSGGLAIATGTADVRSADGIAPADPAIRVENSNSGDNTAFSAAGVANTSGTLLFNRQVEPAQNLRAQTVNWSAVVPATADFRALTANSDEGMVSRFVQDKLGLIFWIRPPEAPEIIFGCLIEAASLHELWANILGNGHEPDARDGKPGFVLALLDDKARPVTSFPRGETARDWKRPFVASEIGEALPHWETALYLATPTALADSARGLRRTLSFTIAAAVALIALGGWLVVADVRRQLALAQKKTDFVSNVSHELKTPLTSIRMFAELMHDRPPPAEKQGQYLRIITAEAERLTRLINNVLDFAKLERRQKRFEKNHLDLHALITRVWEGHEMHLRDSGFTTKWDAAPGPYPVTGDEDALAQILVNLLSNAEKYSGDRKEVELVTWLEDDRINVSVLDRGIGVPDGEERKIFESFYRAHDSLSSGIQGSGLGLTLAQRLAREHGGEIVFERRKDGGSRFTLRLSLETTSA